MVREGLALIQSTTAFSFIDFWPKGNSRMPAVDFWERAKKVQLVWQCREAGTYPLCRLNKFFWDLTLYKIIVQCNVAFGPHSGSPEDCGLNPAPTVRQLHIFEKKRIVDNEGKSPTYFPQQSPPITIPPPSPDFCPDVGLELHPDPEHCER